jgi:hypothetical protein
MQRRTILQFGASALAGSVLGACGGAHDGGTLIEPDPQPAPAPTPAPGAHHAFANAGMMGATPPERRRRAD